MRSDFRPPTMWTASPAASPATTPMPKWGISTWPPALTAQAGSPVAYEGGGGATQPIAQKLQEDPDYFRARSSSKGRLQHGPPLPIADGLAKQLELLTGQITRWSRAAGRVPLPGPAPVRPRAAAVSACWRPAGVPAFRDNTLRADTVLTRGARR